MKNDFSTLSHKTLVGMYRGLIHFLNIWIIFKMKLKTYVLLKLHT